MPILFHNSQFAEQQRLRIWFSALKTDSLTAQK